MRHHASCSRSYVVLILRSTVSDRKMSIQEHWSRNYRALARKHFQSFTLCQANTNRKLLSYGPTLSQIVGAAQFDICLSDSMDNPPKIMQYGALFALIVLDTRQSVRSVPVQKAVTVRFLSKKFRNGWQMPIICSGAVHFWDWQFHQFDAHMLTLNSEFSLFSLSFFDVYCVQFLTVVINAREKYFKKR